MKKTQIQAETRFMDPAVQQRWRKFYLLVGPPGCGKTAWARKLASEQALWTGARGMERVWQAAGLDDEQTRGLADEQGNRGLRYSQVFRAPHHSVTVAGMRGAIELGWYARPGELSLAHGGVLLLDELPEFRIDVLALVLGAIRTGSVHLPGITSLEGCGGLTLPACFSLVASMNPCPCGSVKRENCACTREMIARYRMRVADFEEFCEVVELSRQERSAASLST